MSKCLPFALFSPSKKFSFFFFFSFSFFSSSNQLNDKLLIEFKMMWKILTDESFRLLDYLICFSSSVIDIARGTFTSSQPPEVISQLFWCFNWLIGIFEDLLSNPLNADGSRRSRNVLPTESLLKTSENERNISPYERRIFSRWLMLISMTVDDRG